MTVRITLASCVCVLAAGLPASAQNADGFSIDGYVGGTSDYRDRGLSLSDRGFAAFGSVGVFHDSGFYFGLDAGMADTFNGADGRVEMFTGYSLDAGDYIYDFSFELDSFHGDSSQFYPEFKASISRDFGLAFVRSGASFAPNGRWINPQNDSFYTFADLEIPVPTLPSLTIISHVGHDFRGGISDLWDWSAGLSAFIGNTELSVVYENSSLDAREGRGRVVFGARWYF